LSPPDRIVRPWVVPWLRRLHRWLGLALAAPLLVMGLTGFILVISPPLADLMLPRAPVSGPSAIDVDDGPAIAAIIEAARAAVPNGVEPKRYRAGDTARVDLAPAGQRLPTVRVFVDPATRTILRVTEQPDRFYHWVHDLHENLLLPSPLGHSVIGCIGLGLVCLSLLGIPIWWPRRGRWKAAVTVSGRSTGYLFQREVHGASAIWIVAMLLLQGFSGASMAFPQTFRSVFVGATAGTRAAGRSDAPSARGHGGTTSGSQGVTAGSAIERLIRDAHAAVPDATLIDLRMPTVPNRPFAVVLLPKGSAEGAPPAVVTADPSSLRVVNVQDPRRAGPGIRFLGWLRALHSAEGLGPVWRIADGILALMLPVVSVTGAAMWILRRRNRRRRVQRPSEVMQRAGE
jgi:uncharacterized iron-regulated membrane protein